MAVQAHGCHLRCQLPIALLPTRAPEPDVAVIRGNPKDYGGRDPGPNDVVAVFEFADSSLDFDRSTKEQRYATAGIPSYWIANLVDQVIEVYETPDIGMGKYRTHGDYAVGQTIELSLHPNASLTIPVSEILG
jgi:Uma2 family endonuclease